MESRLRCAGYSPRKPVLYIEARTCWGCLGRIDGGARTGRDYGYNVVVLSDCCYNVEEDIHEIALKRIMPRMARVMTAAEAIEFME